MLPNSTRLVSLTQNDKLDKRHKKSHFLPFSENGNSIKKNMLVNNKLGIQLMNERLKNAREGNKNASNIAKAK